MAVDPAILISGDVISAGSTLTLQSSVTDDIAVGGLPLTLISGGSGETPLAIQGAAGQTEPLLELLTSGLSTLIAAQPDGALDFVSGGRIRSGDSFIVLRSPTPDQIEVHVGGTFIWRLATTAAVMQTSYRMTWSPGAASSSPDTGLSRASAGIVRVGDGGANANGSMQMTEMRLVPLTDATRGSAGTAGRVIYNSDDDNLNIDDGTDWILPDGAVT